MKHQEGMNMTTCNDNVNYLQPTGFRLLIDKRRFANVVFFAQSVDHPGLSTQAADMPIRRFTSSPQLPDTYTYNDLTVTIMIDEDMRGYTELLNWLIQNVEENPQLPGEDEPSYADIALTILTSKNNVNKTIYYRGAFPVDIGSISLSADADGGTVITCPITFRYDKFEIV